MRDGNARQHAEAGQEVDAGQNTSGQNTSGQNTAGQNAARDVTDADARRGATATPARRRALAWLVLLAMAYLAVHAVLVASTEWDEGSSYGCRVAELVLYAAAAAVAWRGVAGRDLGRPGLVFIIATAAVLRVMLIPVEPDSTDVNRYVWDGRVQAAGINPYRYIPADPALKYLRDDTIYPEINRADYAPTIYPPLAQIVFLLVTRVSETVPAMKAAMVLWEAAAMWALLRLLRARGLPDSRVLIYAWHPLPIWEFAGNGHVDAVALACVVLALLAAERGRTALAGVAFAGAVLVKFLPAVVGPALYRRWDWRLPLAAAVVTALLYAPYLDAGSRIFGFLGGYSEEEGLSNGSGLYLWLLLRHLAPLPEAAFGPASIVAALALVALGLGVLFRHRRGADIGGALLLAGTLSALTSPHYPWYLTWLVPFLCFVPSASMFWLTGVSLVIARVGWPPNFVGGSMLYLPFLALVAVDSVLATRRRPMPPAVPAGAA